MDKPTPGEIIAAQQKAAADDASEKRAEATIDRFIDEAMRAWTREAKERVARSVRGIRRDLQHGLHFQKRRELVEQAVREGIDRRITLEEEAQTTAGRVPSESRWNRVNRHVLDLIDEWLEGYTLDLDADVRIRHLSTRDVQVRIPEGIEESADAMKSRLRLHAEGGIGRRKAQLNLAAIARPPVPAEPSREVEARPPEFLRNLAWIKQTWKEYPLRSALVLVAMILFLALAIAF